MIECGEQLGVRRKQQSVAEDVSGHIADTGDGECLGLRIDAHLPKMAFDALPAATRGDAHLLVVIARRATRSKGVTEPEAIFDRYGVSDIGERRRTLVRGNHQVRVVRVAPLDVLRRHDFAADDIVRDIEQPSNEDLVGGNSLFLNIVAGPTARHLFGHESALGADRNDQGVFDVLRFHQAQHFSTKVLAAVGPANATARDMTHAQMHAFDARRVDENLKFRPRQGQAGDFLRIELEGNARLRAPIAVRLIVIGAQHRI